MQKRNAFLISLFVTIIFAAIYFFLTSSHEFETVTITRVLDGDTVELQDGRHVRMLNINAPEKNRPKSSEAADFLSQFLNQSVELETVGIDVYDRILGRLYFQGAYLNLRIVSLGLAHTYLVDDAELKEFRKQEGLARNSGKGIWQKSEYYGCLTAEMEEKEEYLLLEKNCDIDIEGWRVKDESTKDYTFNKDMPQKFTLYSEKGTDTSTAVYWGAGNVWNNDKDSIFIMDENGLLIFYDSYGY